MHNQFSTGSRWKSLTAVAATAALAIVGYVWLRPNREGHPTDTMKVAMPSAGIRGQENTVDPLIEGPRRGFAPHSPEKNESEPTAGAISSGAESGQQTAAHNSASGDRVDTVIFSPPEGDDGRLNSPINCWKTNDPDSKEFTIALDRSTHTEGESSASMAPIRDTAKVGQLFQVIDAAPFKDRRVEVSADMRSKLARRRAGLWIRAYDSQGRTIAADQALLIGPEYTVSGDVEWTTVDVALDIPNEAETVSYGMTMGGTGETWIDQVRIAVSGRMGDGQAGLTDDARSVASPSGATHIVNNLNFEQGEGAECGKAVRTGVND